MANQSDRTRKQQVLDYLWDRQNQWVDGPNLATEAVGGSEGLRRLRELRLEGNHDIRERRHPDAQRDIWQYMLVEVAGPTDRTHGDSAHSDPALSRQRVPAPLALDLDLDDTKPAYPDHATERARREEEAAAAARLGPDPEPAPSAWPADHGQTSIRSAVRKKEDGTFEYVPPQRPLVEQLTTPPDPPQPMAAKFESLPKQIRWGEMAICPRCHMKTTRGRKTKAKDPDDPGLVPEHIRQRKSKSKDEGPALQDIDGVLLYRDPTSRKPKPCERCNGYGIVPNQGPVTFTPPTGPVASDPQPEAPTMELDL